MSSQEKNPKPQLHVSMLNTMARCGIQFQRRYGYRFGVWHEEEIVPPGVAAGIGTAVHASVEANLTSKMETGITLPIPELSAVAADSFHGQWDAGGFLYTEEEVANMKKTLGDAIDLSVALSKLHADEVAPDIEPIGLEKPFVVIMEKHPFDLAGRIDIVEVASVRDTKTIGRTPGPDSARSLQMAMYSLNQLVETGTYPLLVHVDHLVKLKKPKAVTFSARPESRWIDPLFARIERAWKIIDAVKSGKEAFAPANPEDWICTQKFCGYATTCEFFSGRD